MRFAKTSSENVAKSIALATQDNFGHVMKHVGMSQSPTPATRNEATRHLKPPKVTTFAELAIGTAIQASRGRLRTVADGCGWLRMVADGCGRLRTVATVNATSSEHPEWNGNPCCAFGKTRTHIELFQTPVQLWFDNLPSWRRKTCLHKVPPSPYPLCLLFVSLAPLFKRHQGVFLKYNQSRL